MHLYLILKYKSKKWVPETLIRVKHKQCHDTAFYILKREYKKITNKKLDGKYWILPITPSRILKFKDGKIYYRKKAVPDNTMIDVLFDDKTRADKFFEKANSLHNNKFDYSKFKYINAKTKGTIICPIHGEFEQTPWHHANKRSHGCKQCWFQFHMPKFKRPWLKREMISKKEYIRRCRKKYGNKFSYDLSRYNGLTMNKIKITCPIHGTFSQLPQTHLLKRNQTGCFKCGKSKAAESMTDTYESFIMYANRIHDDKYKYPLSNKKEYKNRKSIVKIICKKHGEFKKKAQKHLAGQGCFRCAIDDLIDKNILVGGYCDELFKRKPFLKKKKSYLYYLKINNGKYYKIGITRRKISNRIGSLKSTAKKEKYKIHTIEIINSQKYELYKSFKIEQKILNDLSKLRTRTSWSSELFKKNVWNRISKYFKIK